MKTSQDFSDRIFDLLGVAGFDDYITGSMTTDPDQTMENEMVLINALPTDTIHDVVDHCDVAINLLIPDIKGRSDSQRFRFLTERLVYIFDNYNTYKGDFVRYKRDNSGTTQTENITATNEYFHFNVVTITNVAHDPERQGYSYISVRLSCWIQK